MAAEPIKAPRSNFRQFFFRGLGILLPTILTIWILAAIYGFVDDKIARPINAGVREVIVRFTPYPVVTPEETKAAEQSLTPADRAEMLASSNQERWLLDHARRADLQRQWRRYSIGNWAVLDVIGLVIAVILIYVVGLTLGSFFGKQLWKRGEEFLQRVPVFKAVYPYVKQVTDFLFGGDETSKMKFNQVVAVEYPRKGLWSLGLVTGSTLRSIQERAGVPCVTVFVPSAPTPFTGWVIIVPVEDTIELPISIDDALRFAVSGGVIVPPTQVVEAALEARRLDRSLERAG